MNQRKRLTSRRVSQSVSSMSTSIFGDRAPQALALLDKGEGRDAILEQTGSLVAVHDASVFVNEGEILVLMGLSGSGKSSLLRCINGLNKVSRGRVMVHDGTSERRRRRAATQQTLRRLRRNRISMVFQQFAPDALAHRARQYRLRARHPRRRQGGADADRRREAQAGAARQVRRQIPARALAAACSSASAWRAPSRPTPSILLMDEPFSALDPLIREHLQDELIELQRALQKTIVFVSHDLDEALKIGTRIAIMEAGKVVQFGVPEDIVTQAGQRLCAPVRRLDEPARPCSRAACSCARSRSCSATGRTSSLDRAGRCRCRLDNQGRPLELTVGGARRSVRQVRHRSRPGQAAGQRRW